MQMGMVGLGRMGTGMVRRLIQEGHTCVVYDTNATWKTSARLNRPRSVGSMTEHRQESHHHP